MNTLVRVLRAGALVAVCAAVCVNSAQAGPYKNSKQTETPIKHLIVVIGENHSFDNVFATYVPPDPTQQVWNLLSLGIVCVANC